MRWYMSEGLSVQLAYLNFGLVMVGAVLFRKYMGATSKTCLLWFIYYIMYYAFGILAMGINGFQTSLIPTFIPIIYFIGYFVLLSNKQLFKEFVYFATVCFVLTAIVTLTLYLFNFNLIEQDTQEWAIDRADGVYGDANNAALASLVAFLLFDRVFRPKNLLLRVVKIGIQLIIFYSLFVTFSTTGLFAFTVTFMLTNYKLFRGLRLALFVLFVILFYQGLFILSSEVTNLGLTKAQQDKIMNITNLLTFNFDKVDNSGRGDLLHNILYYINENPILGNGINFSNEHRGHNTFVGNWVDGGLLTFLFFLFLILTYYFNALKLSINLRFFVISVMFIMSIFMISLQSVINQPYLLVIFVFMAYLFHYNKTEPEHLSFLDKD
ncbi:O-antigen ligase family protein [Winogradskyella sp.]|uniref:O-antigen ligase family protein n=1 Tax=Winogradskyella sp. TaxID=1883156 RepID=UPI00261F5920|nr:O-antigen ligase family protein [Winogradskyella sp.]